MPVWKGLIRDAPRGSCVPDLLRPLSAFGRVSFVGPAITDQYPRLSGWLLHNNVKEQGIGGLYAGTSTTCKIGGGGACACLIASQPP